MTTHRWWKGWGDRLPTFAAVIEDDQGNPVNLVGAQAWLGLLPTQPNVTIPSGAMLPNGWTEVPLSFFNASAGGVYYDWQQLGADIIPPGVYRLAARAILANGDHVATPTDAHAELIVWQ